MTKKDENLIEIFYDCDECEKEIENTNKQNDTDVLNDPPDEYLLTDEDVEEAIDAAEFPDWHLDGIKGIYLVPALVIDKNHHLIVRGDYDKGKIRLFANANGVDGAILSMFHEIGHNVWNNLDETTRSAFQQKLSEKESPSTYYTAIKSVIENDEKLILEEHFCECYSGYLAKNLAIENSIYPDDRPEYAIIEEMFEEKDEDSS